jgi:hypothetical protein
MPEYKIQIADRIFEFTGPLKFKQLRLVEPAIARADALHKDAAATDRPLDERFYDEVANVILAITKPIDETFTRAVLDELPTTSNELTIAYRTICIASGVWKPKAAKEGGEQSESPNAPTPSTGA